MGARERVSELRCPFCHEVLAKSDAIPCALCGAGLHDTCWLEAGACPTLGCENRALRASRIVTTFKGEWEPGPDRPFSGDDIAFTLWLGAVVLSGGAFAVRAFSSDPKWAMLAAGILCVLAFFGMTRWPRSGSPG